MRDALKFVSDLRRDWSSPGDHTVPVPTADDHLVFGDLAFDVFEQ